MVLESMTYLTEFCMQDRRPVVCGLLYQLQPAFSLIRYKATRVRIWSDSNYNYKENGFFAVSRGGVVGFERVQMDGSSKMPDDLIESEEGRQMSIGGSHA